MKSEYGDRETLGKQLSDTRVAHISGDPIETPDLVAEMGKSYMRELMEATQSPGLPERFYIMCVWEKMPVEKERTLSFVFISRITIPAMEPETDVYFVDTVAGRLEMLWSLPSYKNMSFILKNPEGVDKQTLDSVTTYKRLEKAAKKKKTA